MVSKALPSLAVLVRRLASSPSREKGEESAMGLRLEVLNDTVKADAFALLRVSDDEGMVTVLGGGGLLTPVERYRERNRSVLLSQLASGCGDHQTVFSPEAPFEDPFLVAERAKRLLMACVGSGADRFATIAIRRSEENFSSSETSRFAAIAYILNLEMRWWLISGENTRLGARDPVTGLGFFQDFHETLGKELSRGRRSAGKVTAGILSLEPVDGKVPGEGDVQFVAGVLEEQLRNFDTIVRYSRRELAFILPDIGGDDALMVMDRVLKVIIEGKEKILPAIRIGFSSYPEDATTVERLIETAEAAVNLARDKGRFAVSRWKD